MTGFLELKRITTVDELRAVQDAAAEVDHKPLYPTHAAVVDGVIVGSMSIMSIPLVSGWSHPKMNSARTTREIVNYMKNLGREKNNGFPVVTLCPRTSPVYPFMERMGFQVHGDTTIFVEKE